MLPTENQIREFVDLYLKHANKSKKLEEGLFEYVDGWVIVEIPAIIMDMASIFFSEEMMDEIYYFIYEDDRATVNYNGKTFDLKDYNTDNFIKYLRAKGLLAD